tara:strand:+ start:244 stop:501 length:258 start_codon:yes stop_codon:yes gene_type:complete
MSAITQLVLIFTINFIFGYTLNSIVKEYFPNILNSTMYQIAYVIFLFNFSSIMGKTISDYFNRKDDFYYKMKKFSENKENGKKSN